MVMRGALVSLVRSVVSARSLDNPLFVVPWIEIDRARLG
jgi:hypothetical protein